MQLTLSKMLADNRSALQLKAVRPLEGDDLIRRSHGQYPSDLVGHLNLVHPQRLQVIGQEEWDWLSVGESPEKIKQILQAKPYGLIIADGLSVSPLLELLCTELGVPLMSSQVSAAGVVDVLRVYLARQLADRVTVPGVMLDVLGLGVMITGESGLGKSELALELITRGHGLVADDITEISQVSLFTLEGRCPEMLRDFIEVRGLGILNVRLIFGETAVRRKMKLKLIVNLVRMRDYQEMPRLPQEEYENILSVPVRRVNLPVSSGRNLAVLVEAAVRQTILKLRGFNPGSEFIRRHTQQLYSDRNPLPDSQPFTTLPR